MFQLPAQGVEGVDAGGVMDFGLEEGLEGVSFSCLRKSVEQLNNRTTNSEVRSGFLKLLNSSFICSNVRLFICVLPTCL